MAQKSILIIGEHDSGVAMAEALATREIDVTLAVAGNGTEAMTALPTEGIRLLPDTRVEACQGGSGDFTVTLSQRGRLLVQQANFVLVAVADQWTPNFPLYDLVPGPFVPALSELAQLLRQTATGDKTDTQQKPSRLDDVNKAVFLNGVADESHPAVTRRVMEVACRLQTVYGIQCYLLTGNLKVAGEGLEALYREARRAGVVFIKFETSAPRLTQAESGQVSLLFRDDVLGQEYQLTPDLCVVDESIRPTDYLSHLADVFQLEVGPDGFLQDDNVHRLTVGTLRKGIWVAGGARRAQGSAEHSADHLNAVLTALHGVEDSTGNETLSPAEIDAQLCIRCLTCYRLCPYRAIVVNKRLSVLSHACERCGICAAECPRGAISFPVFGPDGIDALLPAGGMAVNSQLTPTVAAFCCQRSAEQAARTAAGLYGPLPAGLQIIPVPCAGSLSLEHILSAFRGGVDGVLVMACHEDNCHSERGTSRARLRVGQIRELLPSMGVSQQRLAFFTLAANMGRSFADQVKAFVDRLGGTDVDVS